MYECQSHIEIFVKSTYCSTFRESTEKKELLHSDNSLIDCMTEAVSYQLPYSLR